MSSPSVGYLALLRRNAAYRRLWLGQVATQFGDWFDSIALYAILWRLTGRAESIGLLFIAQYLPSTIAGIWGSTFIDRLPRKLVMIAADLGCAAVVLLLLLVRSAEQVWLIYVVMVVKFSLASLYESARESAIPDVVENTDIVTATTIGSITWSAMQAIGAALGGLVVDQFGTEAAFGLDSLSFVISALLTFTVPMRESHLADVSPSNAWQELRDGFVYLVREPEVGIYALSKALWAIGGGGVILLLTVFGRELFALGENGSISIGLLFAARGMGALIGPVLGQRWGGSSIRFLRRAIGPGFFIMGLGYALFSQAHLLAVACAAVLFAHCGGSVQWVFSTALLQLTVPTRKLGRVFAAEYGIHTLILSLSSYLTGVAYDAGWSARELALWLSVSYLPLAIYLTFRLWREPSEAQRLG
ncbi:MAG: MFS transporter [Gemmataceae bacterium]